MAGKDNLKPFKKGKSGNPKGRPVGAKSTETLMREAIKAFASKDDLLKLGIDPESKFDPRMAMYGRLAKSMAEGKDADANSASKEMLDRLDGKAIARVEQTTEDVTPPTAIELTAPDNDNG